MGYAKWENFVKVVNKAEIACETSGHAAADHFPDVRKMVDLGSGSQREVDDIMLARYASYLVAQNGDPKKQEIAFAQTYFAVQTRRAELIEQRLLDSERLAARMKLTNTEKELSEVIFVLNIALVPCLKFVVRRPVGIDFDHTVPDAGVSAWPNRLDLSIGSQMCIWKYR